MPDSQPSLIGRVAMPHFDWMGALFGGPQYMSSYFANKSAAEQLQEQRGMDQSSARALVADPQFQAAVGPANLPGANMWATAQGGNPNMAAMGSSLFERGVAQGYGKDMATFQTGLQQQMADYNQRIDQANARFNQKITQENTDYSANTQFNLFQKENQYNQDQATQAWGRIYDPANAGKSVMLKGLLHAQGVDVPAGYDPQMLPNGGLMYTPTPGGDVWQTMMKEVQPVQAMQKGLTDLSTMVQQGTSDPASWYATKTWLTLKMKDLAGTGQLDADSVKQFDNLFPDRYEQWKSWNPAQRKQAAEVLRTTTNLINGEMRQRQQKWFLQPGQLPNQAGGPIGIPGVDIPQPPQQGDTSTPPGTPLTHPTATIRAPTTAAQGASQVGGGDTIWRRPETTKRMWQGSGR